MAAWAWRWPPTSGSLHPEARFSANFARLGFHQGFGLSVTLPALVGQQRAAKLLYTGRRVPGDEAVAIGLADASVGAARRGARSWPSPSLPIAASAPLAVASIRGTLRGDLADRVAMATERELAEQTRLRATDDFAEGAVAMAQRRTPDSPVPDWLGWYGRPMAQKCVRRVRVLLGDSRLPRTVHGLDGVAEWPMLRELVPSVTGPRVVDLGCGFGWFCRRAAEQGAAEVVGHRPVVEHARPCSS